MGYRELGRPLEHCSILWPLPEIRGTLRSGLCSPVVRAGTSTTIALPLNRKYRPLTTRQPKRAPSESIRKSRTDPVLFGTKN